MSTIIMPSALGPLELNKSVETNNMIHYALDTLVPELANYNESVTNYVNRILDMKRFDQGDALKLSHIYFIKVRSEMFSIIDLMNLINQNESGLVGQEASTFKNYSKFVSQQWEGIKTMSELFASDINEYIESLHAYWEENHS